MRRRCRDSRRCSLVRLATGARLGRNGLLTKAGLATVAGRLVEPAGFGRRMKVVYVTPRYGVEVVGGAEHAARSLAERLASRPGWSVEAMSSCAIDAGTWADHYEPSRSGVDVNGVNVRRFPVRNPRSPNFLTTSARLLGRPHLATPAEETQWITEQGPHVPELIEAIGDSDADLFVFYPYLYFPTVAGVAAAGRRGVLHPATHDEAPLRLPVFRRVFGEAGALVFQTEGERRLTHRLFDVGATPQLLLGLGVDPQLGDPEGFRAAHPVIGDRPYLVCLGRVDPGKGSTLLSQWFVEYKRRRPGPLALVFVGPIVEPVVEHDDVVMTGSVTEAQKWGALRSAEINVSPSAYEAFSLALIEGWAAERPALVNAACVATTEHVVASGGGLTFDGYASFEAALDRLRTDERTARQLAVHGQQYVDERFRWPALMERYGRFLEQASERARQGAGCRT